MFKRLLVPLDGSSLAESVLPVAAQIARALQGTLILFRVYDIPSSDIPLRVIEAEAEAAFAYLAEVARRPELAGLTVETKTLGGAAALNILDAVQEYRADLLVMSSHGRSGFRRWALGSVAERVVRHTSVPVLVLHGARDGEAHRTTAQAALVALDGSPLAERVLAPTAELLAALSAPQEGALHLVRVVMPPVEISSASPVGQGAPLLEREDQTLREAEGYLLKLAERIGEEGLNGHHPTVTWALRVSEEIRSSLIHAGQSIDTEQHEALFMALATHAHSRQSGSIAIGLLEHSTIPLLIVRVQEQQSDSQPTA